MKLMSLALMGLLTVATYTQAQPPAETAALPASSVLSAPKTRACKKEVRDLCGRRPKGELQSCLKDGVDLKKFSPSCTTEITNAPKPGS